MLYSQFNSINKIKNHKLCRTIKNLMKTIYFWKWRWKLIAIINYKK